MNLCLTGTAAVGVHRAPQCSFPTPQPPGRAQGRRRRAWGWTAVLVAALAMGLPVAIPGPVGAATDASAGSAVRANAPARIDDPASPMRQEQAAAGMTPLRTPSADAPPAGSEARTDDTAAPPDAAAPVAVERKPIESELIRRGPGDSGRGALRAGAGRDGIETGRGSSNYLWRSLSGLAVVVGLIAVGAFILRRAVPGMKRGGGTEAVTVLGRAYVGPKHALHLVKVGRRVLVLGQTPSGVSNVAELTDPDEVQEVVARCQRSRANSITNSFRSIFRRERDAFQDEPAEAAPEGAAGDDDPPTEAVGVVRQELDLILDRVRAWRRGAKPSEGEREA